jgi:Domain of unknown function (DUF6438)
MRAHRTLLVLLAAFLVACTGSVPPDFEVTYESRGTGEGISVLYQARLRADGDVRYEGRKAVKVLGEQEGTIPRERVALLCTALEDLGFFRLQDHYYEGSDGAVSLITVTCGGQHKSISFDDSASFLASLSPEERKNAGIPDVPSTDREREHLELERFADALGAAVGIERWIGTPEEVEANHSWLERDRAEKR